MTRRNRYAVPVDELDRVHVEAEQQMSTRPTGSPPTDAGSWGGALPTAHGTAPGGGGGGDLGGDGE